MSTTSSKRHFRRQLCKKPWSASAGSPLPALEFWKGELWFLVVLQVLAFLFQPANGMRPMMNDRIHKMAMIFLARFPVTSSLYLNREGKTSERSIVLQQQKRFWSLMATLTFYKALEAGSLLISTSWFIDMPVNNYYFDLKFTLVLLDQLENIRNHPAGSSLPAKVNMFFITTTVPSSSIFITRDTCLLFERSAAGKTVVKFLWLQFNHDIKEHQVKCYSLRWNKTCICWQCNRELLFKRFGVFFNL